MTICTFTGCINPRHSHGLCRSHVSQMRRGVPLHPLGVKPPPRPCDFPGCDRPHAAHGLCDPHRQQAGRGEELRPIGQVRPRRECGFDGCNRVHYAKSLCLAHWQQLAKGVTLSPIKPRAADYGDAGCSVPGCDRKPHARGMCTLHYQRWRASNAEPVVREPKLKRPRTTTRKSRKDSKRTLPKGWDRPARPTATVAIAGGVREIGPVPPTPPDVLTSARHCAELVTRWMGIPTEAALAALGLVA